MKKIIVSALAILMISALSLPASALRITHDIDTGSDIRGGMVINSSIDELNSGININRAADDADGLKISEKMRGQTRGLNQAPTNAQDGIGMVEAAESEINN